MFALVHCFQRWGLVDPRFGATIKRCWPEAGPITKSVRLKSDYVGNHQHRPYVLLKTFIKLYMDQVSLKSTLFVDDSFCCTVSQVPGPQLIAIWVVHLDTRGLKWPEVYHSKTAHVSKPAVFLMWCRKLACHAAAYQHWHCCCSLPALPLLQCCTCFACLNTIMQLRLMHPKSLCCSCMRASTQPRLHAMLQLAVYKRIGMKCRWLRH